MPYKSFVGVQNNMIDINNVFHQILCVCVACGGGVWGGGFVGCICMCVGVERVGVCRWGVCVWRGLGVRVCFLVQKL